MPQPTPTPWAITTKALLSAAGVAGCLWLAANAFSLTGQELTLTIGGVMAGLLVGIRLRRAAPDELADLREENLRFRQIAGEVGQILFLAAHDYSRFFYVSPAFEHIWQRPLDSLYLVPDSWMDAVHPDDLERVRNTIATNTGSGYYRADYRIIHPDGSIRWVRARAYGISDDAGRPSRVAGVINDITEYKLAELALHESERALRDLFENSPDPCWLIENRLFTDCNHAAVSCLRYPDRAALLATHPSLLSPETQPDGRLSFEKAEAMMSIALDRGVHRFEWFHRRRDGEIFPVEVTLARVDMQGRRVLYCGWHDITERKRSEAQLRLAASVFAHAHESILITDAQGQIIDVNPTFCETTGFGRDEVLGRNPRILQSGRQSRDFYAEMWRCLGSTDYWRGELWNRRKTGEEYCQLITITAARDEGSAVSHYIGIASDITTIKENQARLEWMAHYDALTQLPNRTLLADRMRVAQAQSIRSGEMLAVVYLDLDGFKPVNDSLGHQAGDTLLIQVAARLRQGVRGGDTVSRLGGDEFVLLLRVSSEEECEMTLTRIQASLDVPYYLESKSVTISASVGYTLYPEDDGDLDGLLRHADHAMYEAKQAGRNCLRRFSPR